MQQQNTKVLALIPPPAVDLATLTSLKFFRGVDVAPIATTLAACATRTLSRDALLFSPGMTGDCMYVVLEGGLRIHSGALDTPAVTELQAGDSIGVSALINREPIPQFVVAAEPARLLVIDEPTFWLLIDSSHGLARNLLFMLAQQLRRGRAVTAEPPAAAYDCREGEQDALTGLNNRRWLERNLPAAIATAVRTKQNLALIMFEVDQLRRITDRHGQNNADEILRAAARTLANSVRPSDFAARYAAGEFVALLPNTPLSGATLVAERLRRAIADVVVAGVDGTPLPAMTISVGAAQWRVSLDGMALLDAARTALDRAKASGRDRVCAAT